MKFAAAILVVAFLSFSALSAERVVVPQLPLSSYGDTEIPANVTSTACGEESRLFHAADGSVSARGFSEREW